jgi:hypothetical protein
MDAQQNDELYPIAVLIDELKVRQPDTLCYNLSASDALYSTTMSCSD